MRKNYLVLLVAAALSLPLCAQLTPVTNELVTATPAGTLHNQVVRSGTYFRNTNADGLSFGGYTGYLGDFVDADSIIWVKNAFAEFRNGAWLRLDRVDEINFVAHTPQAIYDFGGGILLYATRLELSDPDHVYYSVNNSDLDFKFTYINGVLSMADDNTLIGNYSAPKTILGITDLNGQWYGYADAADVFSPMIDVPTTKPASVEASDYVFSHTVCNARTGESDVQRSLLKVAVDGSDVYINNPQTLDSAYWIKGTIDGNEATFGVQYIGPDSVGYAHLWLVPATYSNAYYNDGYGQRHYRNYAVAEVASMSYDPQTGAFSAPTGSALMMNLSPQILHAENSFDDVSLAPFHEVEATPAAPVINKYSEWDNTLRYAELDFNIPSSDVEGNFINPDKLYYNIYVDDPETPFALMNDEYYALTVDQITDIPYAFSNPGAINTDGDSKMMFLYMEGIDSIGVQSIYRGAGVEHRSPIVWHVSSTSGVRDIAAGARPVATAWFDLAGRRIDAPKTGALCIRQTIYSDGSKKTEKMKK